MMISLHKLQQVIPKNKSYFDDLKLVYRPRGGNGNGNGGGWGPGNFVEKQSQIYEETAWGIVDSVMEGGGR